MTANLRTLLAAPCRALVVGMGVTNRAVVGALLRRGHAVVAVDDAWGLIVFGKTVRPSAGPRP